ncbi:hypothetical protein GGR88_000095 [Sphingomonas jejuensis]|uniref:Uncharacterized protein n=1 Tax=Sphingomonas jejuensis TaxID=904715 RepID=A0ABX0XH27_9SPHN|nr:hypothetical protein [Sphingomonas jejuensis]NJC32621.1 hypothetical protein [Sphingomonas jejuensis]
MNWLLVRPIEQLRRRLAMRRARAPLWYMLLVWAQRNVPRDR